MKWRFVVLLAGVIAALTFFACGDASRTTREIDASDLTFEDVQARAVEAMTRPGMVFHITTNEGLGSYAVWIDVERDLSRAQYGEHIEVTYDNRHAMAGPTERFLDAPFESYMPKPSLFAVQHLRWLFDDQTIERSLRNDEVDGKPAIVAEVTRDIYDYDGTETAEVYLNEEYLPIKVEYQSSLPRFGSSTMTFTYEFIDAETIPPDFFSPEPLRELARTPFDDLTDAQAAGLPIYWLGESYEDVQLEEASFTADAADVGPSANYSYAPPDFFVITPCAHFAAYTSEAWAESGRGDENGGGSFPGTLWETFDIEDATVTTYRGVIAPPPGPSDAPVPDGALSPPPADPPLPDVPGDDGRGRRAVIETAAGVVEVLANCGPVGTNEFRTDESFSRMVRSLRPFGP